MESMEAGVALVAVVAYVAARGNPLPLLLSWLGDAFALATRFGACLSISQHACKGSNLLRCDQCGVTI